jgi:Ca2+-binding EF-hand superfamily protein
MNNEVRILEAFNAYDTNKSGHLNKEEFARFAEDLIKIMKEGGVDSVVMLGGMSNKEFTEVLFDGTDLDKNGRISYAEFRAAIQKS